MAKSKPVRTSFFSCLPLIAAGLGLAACTSSNYLEDAGRPDPLSRVTQADLQARPGSGGGFFSALGRGGSSAPGAEVYYGRDRQLTTAERRSIDRLQGEQFEISLENADIAAASRAVLGEVLDIGYSIDPRVTGQVSIVTGRPLAADQILAMFESALRSSGIAMVREQDRLRLMPASEAIGIAELDPGPNIEPGYGVTTLELKHVSSETIVPLMENFVARSGMVREDRARNAIIIQGTASERRSAIEAARSFDQDWLADQSVGIFHVTNSSAEAIMPELERVLDLGEGGRGNSMIRVQPIARSNSVLVVANSRDMLQRAGTWVQRLDRLDASASNLRVYQARHVDAEKLAKMVNDVFADGVATGGSEDPSSQFPPEASPTIQEASARASAMGRNLDQRMGDGSSTRASGGSGASGFGRNNSSGGSSSVGWNGIRITANVDNNTLLIYARPDQQKLIERAITALDKPSSQVAIEATIAEVVLTNDLRYGVQFFLRDGNHGSVDLIREVGGQLIDRVLPGFNLILGPQNSPQVVLDALRGITEVKVLSSPSVVVLDNKPASLQVGDEVPIVTRTAQSVTDPEAPIVNNIEFRNTGVILNVLPRITADGTINLDIEQEISSVSGAQSESLTPTISQRRVNSTVSVSSGQTVLLGGMISERQERGRDGVPVLGEIPVIGDAFRKTGNFATRTELIVLIRAQVIRDSLDAQHVAEEMRSQLRLMNEPSRPVPLPRPVRSLIE
ncbi:MAG: type II secretion system secretin GspD [Rhizobiaceae bacterium]